MKKRTRLLGLLTAAMLLLSACGGGSAPADTGDGESTDGGRNTEINTEDGAATEGGGMEGKDELVFVNVTEPSSLNPGEYNDVPTKIAVMQIHETLVREAIGDRTTLEPLLAESWEFDEAGTTLTFKIKENVLFHNNEIMTAEDVAFSLNKAIAEPSNLAFSSMMINAEVVDDTHVALHLEYAYNPVLSILAIPTFAVVNKAYYEQCQADGTNYGRNPIGTGPYVFDNWVAGSKIDLVAFDKWHKGRANVTNVEYRVMTDATTAAISLESGEIDVFYGVDSADLPRMRSHDDINVLSVQSGGFYYITMNLNRDPYSDEKVRQAMAYCINRGDIIDGGADGVGWEVHCMITPGIFGHQEDFRAVEQDFDKARELLTEAGYPDGLTITMITPEASYYSRPAQVIQEQLRQGGITVDLQIMERGAFNTQLADRDFDTAFYWVGADYPDADAQVYRLFHQDYANVTGDSNNSNVVNAEATDLVERARVSLDNDERYELYGQLAQLNSDNAWYIPIYISTNSLCARDYVGGAYAHSAALFHFADWYY